jgi:hypothetical protein
MIARCPALFNEGSAFFTLPVRFASASAAHQIGPAGQGAGPSSPPARDGKPLGYVAQASLAPLR